MVKQPHPPGPPMALGNMRELGVPSLDRRLAVSAVRSIWCHPLSRALTGWFELASFDFCFGQHSIGTRKAQVPFAILLITYFLRSLLVLLGSRQIFPCFWCHSSSIHSPMDARTSFELKAQPELVLRGHTCGFSAASMWQQKGWPDTASK